MSEDSAKGIHPVQNLAVFAVLATIVGGGLKLASLLGVHPIELVPAAILLCGFMAFVAISARETGNRRSA